MLESARGRRQKLESGKLTHGSAKYGYRYINKREKDGARFEIHPERAQVVQDVFHWRLEGMSIYGIAKRLNEAGTLSAGYNGKPGGLCSKTTVMQMLRSKTYTGRQSANSRAPERRYQAVQSDCFSPLRPRCGPNDFRKRRRDIPPQTGCSELPHQPDA